MRIILVSFLLIGCSCLQKNRRLRYNQLTSNTNGRHFLITTLLERIHDPIEVPRFQGKIVFNLPESLGGSTVSTRSSVACCQLRNVPFKHKQGFYKKEIIKRILEKKE